MHKSRMETWPHQHALFCKLLDNHWPDVGDRSFMKIFRKHGVWQFLCQQILCQHLLLLPTCKLFVCLFFSASIASSFNADGFRLDPSNCLRTSFWSTAIKNPFWKMTRLALDASKRSTAMEKSDKETGVQSECSFDIAGNWVEYGVYCLRLYFLYVSRAWGP